MSKLDEAAARASDEVQWCLRSISLQSDKVGDVLVPQREHVVKLRGLANPACLDHSGGHRKSMPSGASRSMFYFWHSLVNRSRDKPIRPKSNVPVETVEVMDDKERSSESVDGALKTHCLKDRTFRLGTVAS